MKEPYDDCLGPKNETGAITCNDLRSLFSFQSPVTSLITRTLLATSVGIVTLLATVRLDAAPQNTDQDSTTRQSEQGKRPVAKDNVSDQLGDVERSELSGGQLAKNLDIRVVDSDGKPIVGAKVNPWALRSSQGHGSWQPYDHTEMVPEIATSGSDGIATIKYPFYDDVSEQVRTNSVSILVSHPKFVMTESIEIDVPSERVDAFEVKLETGVTLELLPMIDGKPIDTDNLFVSWSDPRTVRRFKRDVKVESTEQGTLRLPPMKAGANTVWLVKIENDQATYLSAVTKVELISAVDNQLEIPLIKATPIEGKLSDNVPRPVHKGRVELETLQSADDPNGLVQWHTWVPVRKDGTFTVNAWPPGEAIRALAICEGFHSNAAELTDPDDPERLTTIRAHVFRVGEPVEIDMVPMAKWVVTVLDENDDPVVGVDVKAWPRTNYAGSYARSEMYLQGRDDQDSYPHRFHQKTDQHGKLTMQLPAGESVFSVTSDVYELPSFLGRRDVRVDSNWGQTDEVTLQLQLKGTDKLGQWDMLAGVVFGCSTREGRRICALPGMQKKMDAFRKQFREAKNQQDPKLLSEAYMTVAEAFAGVGDLEESTKWFRKAAEQQTRIDKGQ